MNVALARGIPSRQAAAWQMIASTYLLKQMEHVTLFWRAVSSCCIAGGWR